MGDGVGRDHFVDGFGGLFETSSYQQCRMVFCSFAIADSQDYGEIPV